MWTSGRQLWAATPRTKMPERPPARLRLAASPPPLLCRRRRRRHARRWLQLCPGAEPASWRQCHPRRQCGFPRPLPPRAGGGGDLRMSIRRPLPCRRSLQMQCDPRQCDLRRMSIRRPLLCRRSLQLQCDPRHFDVRRRRRLHRPRSGRRPLPAQYFWRRRLVRASAGGWNCRSGGLARCSRRSRRRRSWGPVSRSIRRLRTLRLRAD
mmetsp:Transcript_152910/g.488632  ORF Transcript_152910/g.488632 Transcript_152910/m.488632 type:complete len:208 (+) Transcript_152910:246-869(+)